jgi:RNA polymerase sigma factor (sigma-70 family)
MVYRVCWRVLRQDQDVEDAFQATFLLLAQKLHTLRRHASLAGWLHGVAHRVALKARARDFARIRREGRRAAPLAAPAADADGRELYSTLDAELVKLPDRWRLPLILCYLEGKTQDEAAAHLGWSKNTLRRRLEEARASLGRRLSRRGIIGPAALSALLISDCIACAGVVTRLAGAAAGSASRITAGESAAAVVPAEVSALTKGVLSTMLLTRSKVVLALVMVVGLAVGGGLSAYYALGAPQPGQENQAPPARQSQPEGPMKEAQKPRAPADEKKSAPALAKALQTVKESEMSANEKIRLLTDIARSQVRGGDNAAALETIKLASDLVKDVVSLLNAPDYPEGILHARGWALGSIGAGQAGAGDIPGARKTLAVVDKLAEDQTDPVVTTATSHARNVIFQEIAHAEARAGNFDAALKTAGEMDQVTRRSLVMWTIARKQAERKDFDGALATIRQADSVRAAEMLADVARIQEKADRDAAARTWKLAADALARIDPEPDDLTATTKVQSLLPALVERGHGEAVYRWIDGLTAPEVKVEMLLLLSP